MSDVPVEMPADFVVESDTQRKECAEELQKRARQYLAMSVTEWSVSFAAKSYYNPEPVRPEMFARAVRVACALDGAHDCTPDNVESVRLAPWPNKSPGAWRIEVSFRRSGPYSGKEWYVWEKELWEAWRQSANAETTP